MTQALPAPGWIAADGSGGSGLWIGTFSAAPLAARYAEGETTPLAGWVSGDYGRRQPAPLVTYEADARLPLRIVTLVLPCRPMPAAPPAVTVQGDAGGRPTTLRLAGLGDTIHVTDHDLAAQRSARRP